VETNEPESGLNDLRGDTSVAVAWIDATLKSPMLISRKIAPEAALLCWPLWYAVHQTPVNIAYLASFQDLNLDDIKDHSRQDLETRRTKHLAGA
jgi:hypothetical protein